MVSGQSNQETMQSNRKCLLNAFFVLCIFLQSCTIISADDSSTSTSTTTSTNTARPMQSSAANHMTTMMPSSMEMTTIQCKKKFNYDCCQEFADVSMDEAVTILRKVIEAQNNKPNKTNMWSLEMVDSLKMKNCPKPYYVAKAKLNKSAMGENATSIVECQLQFLYSAADEGSAGDSAKTAVDDPETIDVKEFCNEATFCRMGVFITLLVPLLTLLRNGL